MAAKKEAQQQDQEPQASAEETSRQYTGQANPDQPMTARQLAEQNLGQQAKNPVDFANESGEVDVDQLPAVPPAGMFMSAEESTEDPAPPPETQQGGEQQRSSSRGEQQG